MAAILCLEIIEWIDYQKGRKRFLGEWIGLLPQKIN